MMRHTLKLILALLCCLAITSFVSGQQSGDANKSLRGFNQEQEEILSEVEVEEEKRILKSGKGKKSSKAPKKSKGKGGKGKKSSKAPKKSKGKGGKGKKSSKAPKSKGKGGKGKKSSKVPKKSKGKGGKGKKSSKSPKSKGKGGKGKKSSKSPKSKGKGGKGKKSGKSPKSPTASPTISKPTNSCGISDSRRRAGIRDIISQVSDLALVDTSGSSQNLAYLWLLDDDEFFVCPTQERAVLQRYILAVLYFSTDGDEWDRCNRGSQSCRSIQTLRNFEPYLSSRSVCEWFGTVCVDGSVTKVQLGGKNFFVGVNGEMPNELFFLPKVEFIIFDGSEKSNESRRIRGTIPAAIRNSNDLKWLDLDRNELTGPIPDALFSLERLELLDLDNNKITGLISDKFRFLKNLAFLTIGNNNFSPQSMPLVFTQLPKLKSLGLQKIGLTGEIPAEYGNLDKIAALDISFNNLRGNINVLGGYTELLTLALNNNSFQGFIPQSIWNNDKMRVINLQSNSFEGEIPESVGDMSALRTLRLANNKFGGIIPRTLGNLKNLKTLTLEGNNFDNGAEVPADLCKIEGIQITIDQSIKCPGDCCITLK